MKPLSILVADDEENIRALLQQVLTRAGHGVVLTSNARQAREAFKQKKFNLVITDVLMPDGDGLDLIADLKQAEPATRILAISGGGRYVEGDDCLKMARGLGAHAVVMKPFTWEQLRAGIESALAPIPARSW